MYKMILYMMMSILLNLCFFIGVARAVDREEIIALIEEESILEGVDMDIMVAIAKVESGLRPSVTNNDEVNGIPSRGLFQITFPTAQRFCRYKHVESLYMPKLATKCAIKIMKHYLDKYEGDYMRAILAYNSGGHYICKNPIICTMGMPVNVEYFLKVYKKFSE